jgi:rhodanese-related sulfurtransferase
MKTLTIALLTISLWSGTLRAADAPGEKPTQEKSNSATAKTFKDVDPAQFDKLRQSKTNVVLDVRTKKEYDSGHIPGAILLDIYSPDFEKELGKLDKNKTYLVHCASGGRSTSACEQMEKMNFKHLYNLEGGFRAWKKAGKPIEK